MQALTSLIALETSWHYCNALFPDADLFLIEADNGHAFTVKESIDPPALFPRLFNKIFHGECEPNSFKLQMRKVQQLFSSLQEVPLSHTDKESLTSLEKHLNTLGSYVFMQRQASMLSFNRSEKLKEFQVRYTTPTVLSPPVKISRYLPNYSRKICWLNAAINYLASTTLYDKNICRPIADPELEALRQKIFFLVEALRKNEEQQIVNALQEELIEQLKNGRFSDLLDGQQDPNDFLVLLRNHFICPLPAAEELQTATVYSNPETTVLKAGIEKPGSTRLQISSTNKENIDIQAQFSEEQVTGNTKEYLINVDGTWKNTEHNDDELYFGFKEVITRLPNQIEIWLTRGIANQANSTHVSQQEINVGPDGTLVLVEYEAKYQVIDDQVILTSARPKASCTYKVVAAIERLGEKTQRGHFIAYTRSADMTITKHDDSTLSQDIPENVWRKASLLQLECITRTAIEN